VLVNTFFEAKVDQLVNVLTRVSALFEEAGVKYQVVGGMATYLHVNRVDPLEARLTRDIDICIHRADLDTIAALANKHGFQLRHAAGIDMLLDIVQPKARSAVHLIFSGEKVRPDYLAPVPELDKPDRIDNFRIAPISHILQMKLTSYRPKDVAHIQDLLHVGLITPEMESELPPALAARLKDVKKLER
jgi:hypothetical protein